MPTLFSGRYVRQILTESRTFCLFACLLLIRLYFLEQHWVHSKIEQKEEFPYALCLPDLDSLLKDYLGCLDFPWQPGALLQHFTETSLLACLNPFWISAFEQQGPCPPHPARCNEVSHTIGTKSICGSVPVPLLSKPLWPRVNHNEPETTQSVPG